MSNATQSATSNAEAKAALADTFHTLLPKNKSHGITKHQCIDIQIPKSEWILNLQKAYLSVEMKVKAKATDNNPSNDAYFGIVNSACIFDQVSINHGRNVYTDTFCQVNSRLWELSKSDSYLKANYASFLNNEDVFVNKGFLSFPIGDLENTFKERTFHMKIPLPCLFNCFDECDQFPTTQLNDNVTLQMQLSDLSKYMCYISPSASSNGILKSVTPFAGNACEYASGKYVTLSDSEDDYYISDIKLVCPAHYPTPEEQECNSRLISSGMWFSSFKSFDIQAQTMDFYTPATQATNFSTNSNNISGVFIASTHSGSYTIFDKPKLSDLECNLSELYKLSTGGVHTGSTWNASNDMYKDLINYLGADVFNGFNRFDSLITKSYLKGNDSYNYGAFLQFFKAAPGDQLGVDSSFFSHIINYKCKVESGNLAALKNSMVFCCQHSFKYLVYNDGFIDIITPFRDELKAQNVMKNEINANHGVGAALLTAVPTLFKAGGGLIDRIRNAVKEGRAHANTTYAYSTLGKEGYENHRDIIEQNATMRKRKFKKFINSIKNMQNGLLVKHGADDETANSYKLMNLDSLYKPSLREVLRDKMFKMRIPYDYKFGLNKRKLRISSFGGASSLNVSHGFRDWIRDKWNRFKAWIHRQNPLTALKNAGNNLLNVLKQYAIDVLSGKIKIRDIPSKFRNQVLQMIKNNNLTQTPVDEKLNAIIDYANRLSKKSISESDIPENYKNGVQDFIAGKPYFKPDIGVYDPSKFMKARIKRITAHYEKHPELTIMPKHLHRIAAYKLLMDRRAVA